MFANFWKQGSPALTRAITTSMPTAVYLISYTITTLLAATIYLLQGGAEYITDRGTALAGEAFQLIGSPTYLALLYLPVIVVPLAAWLTVKLLKRPARVLDKLASAELQVMTPVLWVIMLISIVYCTMTLHAAGALDTNLLSDGDYIAKTKHRLDLLENLGFTFFSLAYGINQIIPILAFIAYARQGGRLRDLILFIVSFVFFLVIVTATYSKAQILIYLIMVGAAFVLVRAKLKYVAIVSAVSVSAFILTGYAMTGPPGQSPQTAQERTTRIKITVNPAILQSALAATVPVPQLAATVEIQPAPSWLKLDARLIMLYVKRLSGDSLHRMAAAVPFYVAMFEDESERCGIQGNLVRKVLGMPEPQCVLPTKVFNAMYPEIDWAQGQQPAPATLSAYGEIGMPWAVCVMMLCGVFLGLLGIIGGASNSPLFIGFTVAACSFAYYLTQVSIVASFTYPHGIFAFMVPIAALLVAALKKRHTTVQKSVA